MGSIIWLYALQYISWIVSYTVQRSTGTAMVLVLIPTVGAEFVVSIFFLVNNIH